MKHKYEDLLVIPRQTFNYLMEFAEDTNIELVAAEQVKPLKPLIEDAFDKGELSCEKSIEWDERAISLTKQVKIREEYLEKGVEI